MPRKCHTHTLQTNPQPSETKKTIKVKQQAISSPVEVNANLDITPSTAQQNIDQS